MERIGLNPQRHIYRVTKDPEQISRPQTVGVWHIIPYSHKSRFAGYEQELQK